MTLEEYKDVMQLYKLANSWIEDYTKNDIGKHSAKLKKQYQEMLKLQAKTEQLIEKQSGEAGDDLDAGDLEEKIDKLARSCVAFASCFGDTQTPFDNKAPVSKETTLVAIELKKLTATWYGKFSDSSQDSSIASLMASVHEQAKKLISAPKTLDEDSMSLVFYGSKSKHSRKMRKNVEIAEEEYNGLLNIELHLIEDEDKATQELGLESFPTVLFKRGTKTVAKHEGYLSISALQQKVGVLMTGSNFSDSTSVKSITDMKSVNQKELYNMGEHLLFYFEASWCGICKKTTPVVKQFSNSYHKVKFEQIQVDGSHSLHKSFGVNEVPAIVFVHDGKMVGKHTGYINPSNLKRLLEQFAVSNKKNIGNSSSGTVSIIDKEMEDSDKGRKIKDKQTSEED
ncbi:MAG: Thioredoxin [uncultured Aureispira sp.]|uniref:Thioredoxin n=1 Tax=uncultured Aureispira sp. TaxID=1331704 RepID=A0A6S6SD47_9BACT|nr:MAG: Thioredoxin [uncultured Aureispira sp.]